MQKIKRIVAWIALVAVMLSSFAFAEDVLPVDDHEHTEIEQVVEAVEAEEPAAEEDEAAAEEAVEEATEELPAEEPAAEEEAPAEEELPEEEEAPAEEEAGIALLSMEEHEHDGYVEEYGYWRYQDVGNGMHAYKCNICGEYFEFEEHWNSCLTPGHCGNCGVAIEVEEGDEGHDGGVEGYDYWPCYDMGDGTHACKCNRCGEYFGYGEHWNSCLTPGHCGECGVAIEVAEDDEGHDGGVEGYDYWPCYDMGDGTHACKCNRCGQYFGYGEHWNSCLTPGKCGDCGAEVEIDWSEGHDGYVEEYDDWHRYDLGNGKCAYKCIRCGNYFDEDGHWNNCLTPGFCGGCGAALNSDEYEICHDSYSEEKDCNIWVDLGNGMHAEECQRCGATYNEGEHWNTCLNPGHCGECGVAIEVEEGDEGHDGHDEEYGDWRGYDLGDGTHNYKCNRCGEFFGEEGHWSDCTKDGRCGACEAELDPEEYGEGHSMNCAKPGVCENCGCELDPEDYNYGHDGFDEEYGDWRWYDMGDGTHAAKCNRCGEYINEGEHWALCTADGKCGDCGAELDPEEYGDGHYMPCTAPGKCERCGIELDPDEYGLDHNWWLEDEDRDNWIDIGNGMHALKCIDCGETIEEGGHWANCEVDGRCDTCGCELDSEEYGDGHWNSCVNPGKCERCGITFDADREIDHDSWNENEQCTNWVDLGDGQHAEKCVYCGYCWNYGDHGVSCTNPDKSVCQDCGISLEGMDIEPWHNWYIEDEDRDNWVDLGNGKHALKCFDCEGLFEEGDHWMRCDEPGKCGDCGAELDPNDYAPEHHTWNDDEARENGIDLGDGTHEVRCMWCDEVMYYSDHGVRCWCEDKSVCQDCGAVLEEAVDDWHNSWIEEEQRDWCIDLGNGLHAYKCFDCDQLFNESGHCVSCANPDECKECGAKVNPDDYEPEHEYWNDETDNWNWIDLGDGTHGWKCMYCDEIDNVFRHCVTCDELALGVCGPCGASLEGLEAGVDYGLDHHWYDNDGNTNYVDLGDGTHVPKCLDCGYISEDDEPEEHVDDCTNPTGACVLCGAKGTWKAGNHDTDENSFTFQGEDTHQVVCCKCGEVIEEAEGCYTFCWSADKETCYACGATPDSLLIFHSNWGEVDEMDENGCCIYCGELLLGCEHDYSEQCVPCEDRHGYHVNYCIYCGEVLYMEACYLRCDNPSSGVCDVCGAEVEGDVEIAHSGLGAAIMGGTLEIDENGHGWTCTTCGEKVKLAHRVGCIEEDHYVCITCGYVSSEELPVEHSGSYDENGCCLLCGEQVLSCNNFEPMFTYLDNMPGYHAVICANCGELRDIVKCFGMCTQEGDEIGTCAECGSKLGADAEIEHSRQGEWEWQYDANSHWYTCNACGKTEKAPHRVLCNNPGVCVFCGYEGCVNPTVVHDLVNGDEAGYCGRCGKHITHYASCKNPAVCAECGEAYTGTDVRHNYNVEEYAGEAIPGNPDYCGYRCLDCGLWDSVEKHCVSCDSTDNRCVNCGTIVENPELNHQVNWDDFGYDENYHWTTCTVCGKAIKEPHINWCDWKDTCALGCENVHVTTLWHVTGIDYTAAPTQLPNDETKHGWYCATCGDYAAVAEHSYVNGVCICGASLGVTAVIIPAEKTMAVKQTDGVYAMAEGHAEKFEYVSSKPSIASVDANGIITAKKAGTTKITVTATGADGVSVSAEMKLTVKKAPSKLALASKTLSMGVGETKTIKTTISPNGAYSPLTWESSDASVVFVDAEGVLTAKAEGKATIKVSTFNGKTASCTVTVLGAPATLTVDADELKLIVKKTATIKAEVKSEKGGECAGTLSFVSSDPSVATVDAKGKITAKKTGETTITVSTYNGLSKEVKVGVFKAPTKVTLDVTKASLNRGETLQLTAAIAEDSYATFSWSTSSKKVATVDANGLVTAVAEGTATITVKTNNGKKATAKITVVDPYKPTGIVLEQTGTITIDIGEELQLNATLKPATAQSELKWSSSSKKVATVDENGVVTGVKAGTATITVQTHNGKKATVKVKVVKNKAFEPYKGTWKLKNVTYDGLSFSAKDAGFSGMKITASDTSVTMKIGKNNVKLNWWIEDGSLVLEDEAGDSVVCNVVSKNKMSLVFNFEEMEDMIFWFTK